MGLWYDKFCHSWQHLSGTNAKLDKQAWIDTVAKRRCGDRDVLLRQAERRWKMIECLNGRYLDLKNTGPFVAGLGRAHPVENGFLWHHGLGVPYLPGSSVKGATHAWAKLWNVEDDMIRRRIFGSEDQVGEIMFFDALPTTPVQLKADVITPHYIDYDQKGEAPGDWTSPVPIPFLAVTGGSMFRFAVAPRRQSAETLLDTACRWLEDALDWLGAGARTAVGYGRFDKQDHQAISHRDLQKGEAVEATLYKDDKGRWCGRTGDGREGTVFAFGPASDDAVSGEARTLYVRVSRPLQFQWDKPVPKSPSRRSSGKFRRR